MATNPIADLAQEVAELVVTNATLVETAQNAIDQTSAYADAAAASAAEAAAALAGTVKTVDLTATTGAEIVGTQGGRTLAENLSDQLNANNYPSIQAAIDAAGTTGCVIVPANCPHTDKTVNPNNIAITDLRNKQLGIHNVIAPRFPVTLYPFGHDMRVRARASSDMYLEHYNVETSTTQTLSPGWNYNVLIGPVRVGDRTVTEFTGGASLIGPNAQIVLGRETPNEEQVNSPNWEYVDETHLDIFCANSHSGTTDIDQGGSTLLSSHDLYILSGQVKPSQNTTYDAPLRVKDLGGRSIVHIPGNINNSMPYGGWQWGAIQLGMFGANKDLMFQNALSASRIIYRNAAGSNIATLNDTGNFSVVAGIATGVGDAVVSGSLGELRLGRVSTAITSTTDAFVAWQNSSDPLNSTSTSGSLLLASRNITSSAINFATQNTIRAAITASGLRVVAGFGCNGKTPQTAVTVNAAATDAATTMALVNQLRAALIANGICI